MYVMEWIACFVTLFAATGLLAWVFVNKSPKNQKMTPEESDRARSLKRMHERALQSPDVLRRRAAGELQ